MKSFKSSITIVILGLSLGILALVYFVGSFYNIPYNTIMGDPALITSSHPFTGFVSNLGILMWCTTMAICFFTGVILYKFLDKTTMKFYLSSSLLTALLLVDDFFMLHDYIFYSFKYFKITQPITFSVYGFLTLLYFFKFYKTLLKKDYYLIIIAIVFLGNSVLVDLFVHSNTNIKHFIEDALKFLGIVFWTYFFITTSYKEMRSAIN